MSATGLSYTLAYQASMPYTSAMLARVLWHCYSLSRNQWLRPEKLVRLQEKRLRAMVKHAYNNVPLYRKKFDSIGLKPGDIGTISDISKLSFVTKEEISAGMPDQSMAKGYDPTSCVRISTSGTTGGPMPVY